MTSKNPDIVPIVLSGQALLSLRESGHNFPSAVGEVIDNSIEARANHIQIITEEAMSGRKKALTQVSFIDDGEGMDDETLQHYLQLGFSKRFMSEKTIGKFGVGAKLAGLSVGMRIDAWSRVEGSEDIRHVFFDLEEGIEAEKRGEQVGIYPPDDEPLPPHLEVYFPEGSGTMVTWSKIDRVSDGHGRSAPDHVRNELNKELARVFREFLCGGIRITVDHTDLRPHDPTFLRKGTWADHMLTEELARTSGGAPREERHFHGQVFFNQEVKVQGTDHKIRVVIALAPPEVLRFKGAGGDTFARKLRVPDNEGAISFMRLEREISYTPVARLFPGGVQTPDRYIGFEVYFTPELDRMMGVRNVKRGAVPADELRRTLREIADSVIPKAREEIQRVWGEENRKTAVKAGEHAPITKALRDADRTMPKGRVKQTPTPAQQEKEYDNLAKDAGRNGTEEEKAAYKQEIKDLPFIIETVDVPGDDLFQLTHLKDQTIIRLNERHLFYQEMYEPLQLLSKESGTGTGPNASATARRAIEAITLLLVAYAKAESMHETPVDQYKELRKWWGSFTEQYLTKIKDVL
ncbi:MULTISPECIES: ATP-binding protein [unclassified Streptomyces]|uniref:ATP-binding protein n=1 Tax=unclassified Streptomyces TaxID=2593676 RepID=UPI003452596A